MTRNRDLYLEDITGCNHEPELPIVDDSGEILYWRCRCGKRHPVPEKKETPMPETPPVAPEYTELSKEKQALLVPWIEQFESPAMGLNDAEKISVLLGMALGYCTKNNVDFNALLGAALAAEGAKQEANADGDKPESD